MVRSHAIHSALPRLDFVRDPNSAARQSESASRAQQLSPRASSSDGKHWVSPSSFLLSWPNAQPASPGFCNLGNTCYLNAALQCLMHLPPFVDAVGSNKTHRCDSCQFCPFCSLRSLTHEVCNARNVRQSRALTPRAFAQHVQSLNRSFVRGYQQDAHEFVRCLLEATMRAEILGCKRASPVGARCIPREREVQSKMHAVFGGSLQSSVTCKSCKYASITSEPFLDISLEVSGARSVERALTKFTQPEMLSGQNKYRCEGCRRLVEASKRFSIRQAPNVLALHLKRFNRSRKDSSFIEYKETLDLAPYMVGCPDNVHAKYMLAGIVIHSGYSRDSGHYYSYVRNPNGTWNIKDDERSSQAPLNKVLKQYAYILFYVRTPPPPTSPPSTEPAPSSGHIADVVVAANEQQKQKQAPNGLPKEYPASSRLQQPVSEAPRDSVAKSEGVIAPEKSGLKNEDLAARSVNAAPNADCHDLYDRAEIARRAAIRLSAKVLETATTVAQSASGADTPDSAASTDGNLPSGDSSNEDEKRTPEPECSTVDAVMAAKCASKGSSLYKDLSTSPVKAVPATVVDVTKVTSAVPLDAQKSVSSIFRDPLMENAPVANGKSAVMLALEQAKEMLCVSKTRIHRSIKRAFGFQTPGSTPASTPEEQEVQDVGPVEPLTLPNNATPKRQRVSVDSPSSGEVSTQKTTNLSSDERQRESQQIGMGGISGGRAIELLQERSIRKRERAHDVLDEEYDRGKAKKVRRRMDFRPRDSQGAFRNVFEEVDTRARQTA